MSSLLCVEPTKVLSIETSTVNLAAYIRKRIPPESSLLTEGMEARGRADDLHLAMAER